MGEGVCVVICPAGGGCLVVVVGVIGQYLATSYEVRARQREASREDHLEACLRAKRKEQRNQRHLSIDFFTAICRSPRNAPRESIGCLRVRVAVSLRQAGYRLTLLQISLPSAGTS